MNWSKPDLDRIAETDDLHISPFREDGITYGTPTWIWSVVVDGDLYVRGYNGQKSRWYQAAVKQKAGRISAAGMTRDVAFEPADRAVDDAVDDAYRSKYGSSSYLGSMISARARARHGAHHAKRSRRPIALKQTERVASRWAVRSIESQREC